MQTGFSQRRSWVARRVVGRPEMCPVSMSWRLTDDSEVIRVYTKELYPGENQVTRREVRL